MFATNYNEIEDHIESLGSQGYQGHMKKKAVVGMLNKSAVSIILSLHVVGYKLSSPKSFCLSG